MTCSVCGALLLTCHSRDWLEKVHLCRNGTSCMERHFYLKEQLMGHGYYPYWSISWTFSWNWTELSITIASDKIQVFKRKSQFWKVCICQAFLMRSIVKLMECDLSTLYEMPAFGSSAWVSEGLLFQIASG